MEELVSLIYLFTTPENTTSEYSEDDSLPIDYVLVQAISSMLRTPEALDILELNMSNWSAGLSRFSLF